jgi:tetratricopeptide (TPR) repeat protein
VSTAVSTATSQLLLEMGRLAEARERFWSDAHAAEAAGDADALAVAALGLGGIWVHEHRSTLEHARVTGLQHRALAAVDPCSPLAPRLRMRLAAEQAYLTGDGASVLGELGVARRRADPLGLAEALSLTHHCLLGPHHARARMALADELIHASSGTGRRLDGLMGLAWRTVDLFLAGDRRATRSLRELRERLELERCDCLGFLVTALDVTVAMRAGRLDEAEQLAEACYQIGLDVGDADAFGWYGAQLVAIRWLQGRGGELLPLLDDLVHSTTVAEPNDGFVAAIAALAACAGDHDAARAALACLRARGLHSVPSSSIWLATMLGVCEAAHALGDADAAREAYELLAPFARLPVMASLGVACYGSAHRPLGLAAWTMGQLDLAIEHLEAAAVADLATGNGPCHSIAIASLADALERRGETGDADRAATLRNSAIDAARRFGMIARAEAWEQRARCDEAAAHVACRRDGRVWMVRLGERAAVVPHSVGMEYLTQLIGQTGVAIPAVELASRYAMSSRDSAPDPVLDARAKEAYRRRIEELREEVDDAEACADLERAARARVELDRFVEELARVTGFAGRTRSFDDSAERARVSVHKAIKRAVAMIAEVDPTVGGEIRSRLVTGMRCVFLARAAG